MAAPIFLSYLVDFRFCGFCLFVFFDEFRQDFVQVADDAEVGYIENGGSVVFVDGDDQAGFFHACQVLNGAGNTEGEVNIGAYGFARLADLAIFLDPAGVDCCP